jgi:hypothetical protein
LHIHVHNIVTSSTTGHHQTSLPQFLEPHIAHFWHPHLLPTTLQSCSKLQCGCSIWQAPTQRPICMQSASPASLIFSPTAKQGEPSTLPPPFYATARTCRIQTARGTPASRIRSTDSAVMKLPKPHLNSTNFLRSLSLQSTIARRFKNTMDATPNIVFDRGIDWSQWDLLDACYWPVDTGLQLGR